MKKQLFSIREDQADALEKVTANKSEYIRDLLDAQPEIQEALGNDIEPVSAEEFAAAVDADMKKAWQKGLENAARHSVIIEPNTLRTNPAVEAMMSGESSPVDGETDGPEVVEGTATFPEAVSPERELPAEEAAPAAVDGITPAETVVEEVVVAPVEGPLNRDLGTDTLPAEPERQCPTCGEKYSLSFCLNCL